MLRIAFVLRSTVRFIGSLCSLICSHTFKQCLLKNTGVCNGVPLAHWNGSARFLYFLAIFSWNLSCMHLGRSFHLVLGKKWHEYMHISTHVYIYIYKCMWACRWCLYIHVYIMIIQIYIYIYIYMYGCLVWNMSAWRPCLKHVRLKALSETCPPEGLVWNMSAQGLVWNMSAWRPCLKHVRLKALSETCPPEAV